MCSLFSDRDNDIQGNNLNETHEDSSESKTEEYFDSHESFGESADERSTDDVESEMESDEQMEDQNFFKNADEPLYRGALITIVESTLAILMFSIRHKISRVLLKSFLELIAIHCIRRNNCLNSLYKFKKFFSDVKTPLIRHFYCSKCKAKFDTEFCFNCNSKIDMNYFLQIPVLAQLQKMYERPNFHKLLMHRLNQNKIHEQNYEDIYDGTVYKSCNIFLNNPSNISLMWNVDGVSLFNSSKFNIWPLYLIINELPYKERYKKENVIFAGLWLGTQSRLPICFCLFIRISYKNY